MFERLINPSPHIEGKSQLARAKTLAVLTLSFCIVALVTWLMTDNAMSQYIHVTAARQAFAFAILGTLGFYGLVRSRIANLAGLGWLFFLTTLIIWTAATAEGGREYGYAMRFIVIPLIICAILYERRWTLALFIYSLVTVAAGPFVTNHLSIYDALREINFVLVIGALSWAAIHLREMFIDQELRLDQASFKSMLDGAEDVIFLVDRDHRFTLVNDKGDFASQRKIVGFSVSEVMGPERGKYYADLYDQVFTGGKSITVEQRDVTPRGDELWHSSIFSPVRDHSGNVTHVLGITRDIGELKRVERELKAAKDQAEKASRAKSEFLAVMSHEVRTPMGAIQGFAEILASSGNCGPEEQSYISAILRNTKYLGQLLDGIVDVSKLEAGHLQIQLVPTDLRLEIKETLDILRGAAKKKGLELSIDFDSEVPRFLLSDPIRLRQVLVNLIDNAIKCTSKGGISVNVSVSTDDRQVYVDVKDTGIGIDESERERVFDLFYQSERFLQRTRPGSGMGLYLAREIARALGGDLKLYSSTPNVGSVFRLFLDNDYEKKVISDAIGLSRKQVRAQQEADLSGVRVLLVEDNPDHQALATILLEKANAKVVSVSEGLAVKEAAKANEFDVVLMDIQLPKLDGHQAFAELKSMGFDKPVIAITAHADSEERARCRDEGFEAYLLKPVDGRTLITTIKDALRRRD